MANSPSARKRIRTAARRTQINKTRLSSIRTFVKKVEAALEAGNADAAKSAFHDAQPLIMRGVAKGVLHKNTASRKISRLSTRIKKLGASAG